MHDTIDNSNPRTSLRNRSIALLIALVSALALVGVAIAANSASFTDPAGDVILAPDISGLNVSSDDAGKITIQVAVAGGRTIGLSGDVVGVALDLDQNPDTGTIYYGTDVAIVFHESTMAFLRPDGNAFGPAPPPASLRGAIGNGVVSFTIDAADLGLTANAGFNAIAISDSDVVGEIDTAPDIRTFNYQQVPGTPPPSLGPDNRAPVDHAITSHGAYGKVARLFYRAADGRGLTADTLRVYRRARLLRTIRISLGDANPFLEYYARWRVPRTVRGKLRFCVQSSDAALNKSNLSCARLTIR